MNGKKGDRNSKKREKEYLLVKAAQKGDEKAFSELFEMYYKSVYYVVFKIVKNDTEAEDITVEAFTSAFNNIKFYEPTAAFFTWLSRIAVNRAIDCLRKKKSKNNTVSIDETHPQAEDENFTLKVFLEDGGVSPEKQIIKQETKALLEKFIDELPPDYSRILKMRYFEQLSYKEIEEKLDIPLGTVKARLFRGRQLLAAILKNSKLF